MRVIAPNPGDTVMGWDIVGAKPVTAIAPVPGEIVTPLLANVSVWKPLGDTREVVPVSCKKPAGDTREIVIYIPNIFGFT